MNVALIVGAAILVVALIAVLVLWRRRAGGDTVAAFQRHIDALGPQARKPTVERVQELDTERRGSEGRDPAGEDPPDGT